MNKSTSSVQKQLFFNILQQLKTENKGLADLAKILNIKTTAMYARLSGKKLLSLEELRILSTNFNISLDALFQERTRVEFDLPSLTNPILSEKDYLLRLSSYVDWTKQQEAELFYVTSEVPIFYYLHFEELGLFKLFIYGRTVWETEKTKNNRFSFDLEVVWKLNIEKRYRKGILFFLEKSEHLCILL